MNAGAADYLLSQSEIAIRVRRSLENMPSRGIILKNIVSIMDGLTNIPFSYLLSEITLLGFPLIGGLLCHFVEPKFITRFIKIIFIVLLPIDLLYLFNISLSGDYSDYIVYSLHYLLICFWVINKKDNKRLAIKIGNITGIITLIIGSVVGVIGFMMFIIISQNWETDRQFYFNQNGHLYEVRRYTAGFVTWSNTEYTFETYRKYLCIPVEKKLDVSNFFDDQTNLNVAGDMTFHFVDSLGKRYLVFKDKNGVQLSKIIK